VTVLLRLQVIREAEVKVTMLSRYPVRKRWDSPLSLTLIVVLGGTLVALITALIMKYAK
jgi:hypothetical protein